MNMDIQAMKDQVNGLIEAGKQLRVKEAAFLKLQGKNEEIEKALQAKTSLEEKHTEAKENLAALLKRKNDAVSKTMSAIAEKMGEVLPVGTAIFERNDDDENQTRKGFYIGWKVDGKEKPYNGLSGGEKQVFDAAIAHVLNANIIVLEAAELDDDHILAAFGDLGSLENTQVLINTCHHVENVPEPFIKIDLNGNGGPI